ncbi:M48 family metalloprotease [Fodinibius sp.]|uniref:M48 family metalloprotease n=1 Tax=Fodinibius sp. TaxID=1872440 RepID=UPI002ACD57F0|nr:M48 family metalloprotease [Fodinibius sp.]MDZ7659578.1 M48 family metalloprotease [Fodinibius sp.]
MARKYILFSLLILFITGIAAFVEKTENLTVKNTVDMRNGPGSYYKLILRLNAGAKIAKIDKQQQWLKVKAHKKEGWIPERATYVETNKKQMSPDQDEVTSEAQTAFDQLESKKDSTKQDPYASPAQVAAAVKGFATDFTSSKTGKKESAILDDFNNFVDPDEYREFRNFRLQHWNWQKAQDRFEIDPDKVPELNPLEERAGWGIANVIAQQGLVKNKELQQYLTHIALVLAENSHRYETPARVYILDTSEITGYASPNGIIFVSKGALQIMRSETEFAFFVGHELAHIVHNHGIKESNKRETKIKAEEGFEELDQELGNRKAKYEETEENLTQLANEMYEYTIKDRLEEYEFSADYWGIIYMYRAGYNPAGALNLLKRIRSNQGDFKDRIGHAKWKGASLRDRIIRINSQTEDFNLPQNFGHDYQSTFQQKVSTLDN